MNEPQLTDCQIESRSRKDNAERAQSHCHCIICGHETASPDSRDLGAVRGNTARFLKQTFHLWKCPRCQTIHGIDLVNFQDIYKDYPLNKRQLDFFARLSLHSLLRRLKRAGLTKTSAVLDYGCGNGVFVHFLKEQGYESVAGYDPFVEEFADLPAEMLFDYIVANDVIEHVTDPRLLISSCIKHLKPGGILYIGTTDSEGVMMNDLEPHIMRLHQPFHRIIFNQHVLKTLGTEAGLELVKTYWRSYMDTLIPFVSYRFLDEFSKALGHDMDKALDPSSGTVVFRRPILLFYGFCGYLLPSAYEPAVVLRRPRARE